MDNTLFIGSKVETGLGKQFLQGSKEKISIKNIHVAGNLKHTSCKQQEEIRVRKKSKSH